MSIEMLEELLGVPPPGRLIELHAEVSQVGRGAEIEIRRITSQVGRELMERKYRGKLDIAYEVVSGTKVEQLVPAGTADRQA